MDCAGHQPETRRLGIQRVQRLGLARRDVDVAGAVDQEDWNAGRADGRGGRGLPEVHAVAQAHVEEAGLGDRPGSPAPQPGDVLQAAIGDILEGRKRALRDHRAEARLAGQGFDQNRRAHGFSQAVEAFDGKRAEEPGSPGVDVGGFADAIGGHVAAASAVAAAVGRQHGEPRLEQKLRVVEDAAARVADPVQQNDRRAVGLARREQPGAERRAIGGGDACGLPGGGGGPRDPVGVSGVRLAARPATHAALGDEDRHQRNGDDDSGQTRDNQPSGDPHNRTYDSAPPGVPRCVIICL